jgi:hypothetical protein
MLTSLLWLVLIVSSLAAAAAGVWAYGAQRWAEAAATLKARLEAARVDQAGRPGAVAHFDSKELEGLPAPVQRYFRTVLKEGQPVVSAVDLELVGTFNMSSTKEQWKPFTSRQRVVTRAPGFLWDAEIAMLAGVAARVHDAYVAGEGLLHAAVLGVFTVADIHGAGEIARGELFRFFAEAAWYPTALLLSQGVHWEAIDDRSANATLVDGPITLTLLFRFNDDGLIGSVRAESRGAIVGNKMVMTPWEGRWSDYRIRDGMPVPNTGEVAWLWPRGPEAISAGR